MNTYKLSLIWSLRRTIVEQIKPFYDVFSTNQFNTLYNDIDSINIFQVNSSMNTTHLFITPNFSSAYPCILESTCYVVNASTWLGPLELIQPIYGVCVPILTFITIFFNITIIIVLSRYKYNNYLYKTIINDICRPKMKSATNTVLMSMAISDLLTIMLPLPW